MLTIHHWPDRARGLSELARVARDRVVVFTWDPASSGFWLVDDYFPALVAIDRPIFPTLDAYWRRPAAYLDAAVRAGISTFTKLPDVEAGVARLRRDLEDGTWTRRYGALAARTELDLGYRLVVARVR